MVASQGSPALQALAAVAAQVDRQVGSLPLPPIEQIFRRDTGGVVCGQATGGAGGGQPRLPGVVYPAVPGLPPLMLPDDPRTQRCAAELAHLGVQPLNLMGAATVGPAMPYVPPPIHATAPSLDPAEPGRLVIVTTPSIASVALAGPLSAPASLPSSVVVTGLTTSAASSAASAGATLGVAAARGRTISPRGRHDTF